MHLIVFLKLYSAIRLSSRKCVLINSVSVPKIASVQARKLGVRNVLDEGEGIMEKHNMKLDEFKVGDMTKTSAVKRTVDS